MAGWERSDVDASGGLGQKARRAGGHWTSPSLPLVTGTAGTTEMTLKPCLMAFTPDAP